MDPVVRLPLTSCDSRFDVDPTKLHAWTQVIVAFVSRRLLVVQRSSSVT